MKLMLLIVLAVTVFFLGFDMVDTLAREFEVDQTSRIEKPDRNNSGTDPERSWNEKSKYHSMIATAYCLTGSTATGTTPRIGVAASKPEWYGKQVKVYWNDCGSPGSIIGTYTVEDTGGYPIKSGSVIDIWLPTEDECFEFGRRLVLVEVLE